MNEKISNVLQSVIYEFTEITHICSIYFVTVGADIAKTSSVAESPEAISRL